MKILKQIILSSKFPLVNQYDMADCGPAALLSVLRFYNGNTNLVRMRELCNTNTSGSTMLDLVNAAKEIGFDAVGASGEYEDLMKERMPCIAHVISDKNLQHFIVIYKISKDYLFISDPAKGRYKLSKDKFLVIWKSKAVVLIKVKGKLLNEKDVKWFTWIIEYLKKEESWVYQSVFLGIVYTLIGLFISLFVQWIIDRFIPAKAYSKIIYTGIFLLSLLVIKSFAGYLRQRFLVILNKRVNIKINSDFIAHLFHLPKKFFDSRKTGDITARINDAVRIQQAILKIMGTTIIDIFIIAGALAFMFVFSAKLALIALITVPFYFMILIIYTKKIKVEQNDVMKGYAQVEATYYDSIGGIDDIICFNSAFSFSKLNKIFFGSFQGKIEKLGFTQALLSLSSEIAGAVISIGLLIFGAILVISGELLLGQMMAAYSLLAYLLPSVNRLADANISLQGASIATNRLMDMFLVEKEKSEGNLPFNIKHDLSIKNASFSWNGKNYLFKNLTIEIEKGKICSIIGKSGSGKSTLVQIIQRKYNLLSGKLLVDGIDANNIILEDYRKNIGAVPQNIKIFNGTISDNILAGRTIKNLNELSNRIIELGLQKFYSRFNQGLFTLLGEDNRKLSGGEKQIIALTRALWDKPEILILDESLSGIDLELEALILKVLFDYSRKHAVVIITHNLQTILKTDFVYLLKNGQIIQRGNPKILISEKGSFQEMYKFQEEIYSEQKEMVNE